MEAARAKMARVKEKAAAVTVLKKGAGRPAGGAATEQAAAAAAAAAVAPSGAGTKRPPATSAETMVTAKVGRTASAAGDRVRAGAGDGGGTDDDNGTDDADDADDTDADIDAAGGAGDGGGVAPPRRRPRGGGRGGVGGSSRAVPSELRGHSQGVGALAVLPDGRFVSGSNDETLRVWNTRWKVTDTVEDGLRGAPRCMAVLTDGGLAIGHEKPTQRGYTGAVTVWDVAVSPPARRAIVLCARAVHALAALPRGRLAVGWRSGGPQVMELPTGTLIGALEGHDGAVCAMVTHPSRGLVTGGADCTVRMWDVATDVPTCTAVLTGHTSCVRALVTLPTGAIASGDDSGTVRLWEATTGRFKRVLHKHGAAVRALTVLPDGRFASGSTDKTIRVWEPASGMCTAVLSGRTNAITALVALPGDLLVSGSSNKTIRVWPATPSALAAAIPPEEAWLSAFGAGFADDDVADGTPGDTPHGGRGDTAKSPVDNSSDSEEEEEDDEEEDDGSSEKDEEEEDSSESTTRDEWCKADVVPVPAATGEPTLRADAWGSLRGHEGKVVAMTAMTGGRVATVSTDDSVRVWDMTTGCCLTICRDLVADATSAQLCELPSNRLALVQTVRDWQRYGKDNTDIHVTVWDLAHTPLRYKSCLGTIDGIDDVTVAAVAVVGDGVIALAGSSHVGRTFNTNPGVASRLTDFYGHTKNVSAVVALPPHEFATGGADMTVCVWDLSTGDHVSGLRGHTGGITCLAALADGRLASGSRDATIRVWGPSGSRACVAVLRGHYDAVLALQAMPDGTLASAAGGYVRWWDTRSGRRVAVAFSRHLMSPMAASDPQVLLLPDSRVAFVEKAVLSVGPLRRCDTRPAVGDEGGAEASDQEVTTTPVRRAWYRGVSTKLSCAGGDVDCLAVLADGKLAVSYGGNSSMAVCDVAANTVSATRDAGFKATLLIGLPGGGITAAHTPNTYSWMEKQSGIILWDAAGHVLKKREMKDFAVVALTVMPSGAIAVVGSKRVVFMDATSGAVLGKGLTPEDGTVTSGAAMPDGSLALGMAKSMVEVWPAAEAKATRPPRILSGHTAAVNTLLALPDDKLATGSDDKCVRVWDFHWSKCNAVLRGHRRAVVSLARVPDGRLASGSDDGSIRLWAVSCGTGTCTAVLRRYMCSVTALAVLPDGRLAATAERGIVRLWNVPPMAAAAATAAAASDAVSVDTASIYSSDGSGNDDDGSDDDGDGDGSDDSGDCGDGSSSSSSSNGVRRGRTKEDVKRSEPFGLGIKVARRGGMVRGAPGRDASGSGGAAGGAGVAARAKPKGLVRDADDDDGAGTDSDVVVMTVATGAAGQSTRGRGRGGLRGCGRGRGRGGGRGRGH